MQLTGCASPKWGRSPGFLAFSLDLLPGMREPSPIQIRFLLAQGVRQRLPVSAGVDGIQHRQRAAPSKEETEKEAEDGARENAHRSFVAILSLLLLYAACLTPRRTRCPQISRSSSQFGPARFNVERDEQSSSRFTSQEPAIQGKMPSLGSLG